jgi:hypothetical protein
MVIGGLLALLAPLAPRLVPITISASASGLPLVWLAQVWR